MPPEITDYFGKSSIDTDYAIATTVSATRAPGASVLEVVDVSKFADDTPVFIITYKKDIDPETNAVTAIDVRSFKALINAGADTFTNLTIAPGYVDDLGNDEGDFVECIPTSYWENQLIDGIREEHNPDGTHSDIHADSITTDSLIISGNNVTAGWSPVGVAVSSVTNNGNRSYDLTMASTMAAVLSPGMRLRTTRTVAAPVQSADLEASSSQYFSKSSPAGMTFTDDFTCMGWIKPESYGAQTIISRYNGTTGFTLNLTGSGTVRLQGLGTAGVQDIVESYQSVQLDRWTHVAVSLDMSGTSGLVYIDGVLVTSSYTNGGVSAIVQAGNLQVGAQNGATNPFDGKIAQAAVFSSVLSAATIRSYMSQGLLGSESTLCAAYSLDNSLLDLSANDNDLTANGGALATATDSPFGGQGDGTISSTLDYGLVIKVATTTVTVQVPEGCTIPAIGGVTTLEYSVMDTPFNFPKNEYKWAIINQEPVGSTARSFSASPAGATWYALASILKYNFPVGNWKITGRGGQLSFDRTAGGTASGVVLALSTSSSVPTNYYAVQNQSTAWDFTGTTEQYKPRLDPNVEGSFSLAVPTDLYVLAMAAQSGSDLVLTSDTPLTVALGFFYLVAMPEGL